MDFIKMKYFCISKDITEGKEKQTDWEKMSASYISEQGHISRIYKEFLGLTDEITNHRIKNGQKISIDFHQRRYLNGA